MLKKSVVVVGSGASGVEFSLGLLAKGYRVIMLDTGNSGAPAPEPELSFNGLKQHLPDPAKYLLGDRFQGVILPSRSAPYYSFPPSKSFVYQTPDQFRYETAGISPLFSFAAGGLGEAWTGGCYPFRDSELIAFPFRYKDLAPYYGAVARRIGIAGVADDDLSEFFPAHDGLQQPLALDEHSRLFIEAYDRKKESLNRQRFYVGRSRVAALSSPINGRAGCSYCGRCQWGCPSGALYTPALGLAECRKHEDFEYRSGLYVDHFRFDSAGQVHQVVAYPVGGGTPQAIAAETLVLAAGALCSSNILLRSVYLDSGERPQLRGLMDNRQVLMPFVNLRMIGRDYNPDTYQYHQVAIGVQDESAPGEYLHGLVTTLKTAIAHPVIQSLPFDIATSTRVFRNIRAALGLVNLNFSDTRRESNYVALEVGKGRQETRLVVHYAPSEGESERLNKATQKFRRCLLKLSCIAPASMTKPRPMGASVHYAGTLPMRGSYEKLTSSRECRSHDFPNLFLADGATFPSLPAKNLTFTLMANAARIAAEAF